MQVTLNEKTALCTSRCRLSYNNNWEGRTRTCDAGTKNQSLNHLATSQCFCESDCSHMQANSVLMNRLAPRPDIILRLWDQGCARSTITAGQASLWTHWRPASDFSKPRKDSQLPYVFNLACFSSLMQAYRFFKHGIYNKRTGVCKALT